MVADSIVVQLLGTDDDAEAKQIRASFQAAGSLCAGAVLTWPQWCHRKVEAIALLEGPSARRRVSVDCTPPAIGWPPTSDSAALQVAVPLTFVTKGPMRTLDVVDSQMTSLPVLGRRENGLLMTAALESAIEGDVQKQLNLVQWRELLFITWGPPAEARAAAAAFIDDHSVGSVVAGLLRDAAENFLFCVLIPRSEVGRRQVLKYSWHWDSDRLLRRPADVPRRQFPPANPVGAALRTASKLGLREVEFEIALGSPSSAASYHLEVPTPPGLDLRSLTLPSGASGLPVDTDSMAVGHAYESYANDPDGNAIVTLDIARHGLLPRVAGAAVGTFLIFLLTLALPGALHALRTNGASSNSLLLFGPASLLALVAGRRENVVAASVLFPVRLLALTLSLLLFIAGALLTEQLRSPWITLYWAGAAALSGLIATVLLLGILKLRSRSSRQEQSDGTG